MAISVVRNQAIWIITIKSKNYFNKTKKDFIVNLITEEIRSVISRYYFILHEVLENKKEMKIIIGGSQKALKNLLNVLKNNLFFNYILCVSRN